MDSNLTIYGCNNDNSCESLEWGYTKKFLCRSLMCSILKDHIQQTYFFLLYMPYRIQKHAFNLIKMGKENAEMSWSYYKNKR